jgi:hypothetical protein
MSDTVASLIAKYRSGRIQYFAAGCNSLKSPIKRCERGAVAVGQQLTVDAIVPT